MELDSLRGQRADLLESLARASDATKQSDTTKAAIAELDGLIALAEDRIATVARTNERLEDTRGLLLRTEQYGALIGRIDEAFRLVDFDRRYWSSFYSIRSAGISEVCQPPSALPRVVK